ncbi:MAG: hypothetical protein R3B89_17035 [Polyangiaceae bacterium]
MAAKKKRGVPQHDVSDEARQLARQLLAVLDKAGMKGNDSDAAVFARAGLVGLVDGTVAIVGGTIVQNSTTHRERLKRAREVLEGKPGSETARRRKIVAAAQTALSYYRTGDSLGMSRVAMLMNLLRPIDEAFRTLAPRTEVGEMNGKIITLAAKMEHANASPVTIAALACKLAGVEKDVPEELDESDKLKLIVQRFKDAL